MEHVRSLRYAPRGFHAFMTITFAIAAALILYAYAGYPIAIRLLARFFGRPHSVASGGGPLPSVTIVVAAHQEAPVIGEKVRNSLAIDYPPDLLDLVVVSDGSTDGTDAIVAASASPRVRLLRQEPRQGKAAALGRALGAAPGEIVLFTDANVMLEPDAVRRLIRHFADPGVGLATGRVDLVDKKLGYAQSEGAYYRYERFLQSAESRFESVVGVDGALYAARRVLVAIPPPGTILDDFVTSMEIAARGPRIIYDPEARAFEDAAPSLAEEFRRKRRIGAGAVQSLRLGLGVPGLSAPRLLFCYLSHKVLRWAVPPLLLVLLATSVPLAARGGAAVLPLAAQLLFYGAAALGLVATPLRRSRAVALPMYFVLMNASVGAGLVQGAFGPASVAWTPTARTRLEVPNRAGERA